MSARWGRRGAFSMLNLTPMRFGCADPYLAVLGIVSTGKALEESLSLGRGRRPLPYE